jgi:C-terminal processing protease CtpA/Prc
MDTCVSGHRFSQRDIREARRVRSTRSRSPSCAGCPDASLDVAIACEIVHVRPVRFHVENGDIGYIRVTSLNEKATDVRDRLIFKDVPPKKFAGYVMDLRKGRAARPALSASSAFL